MMILMNGYSKLIVLIWLGCAKEWIVAVTLCILIRRHFRIHHHHSNKEKRMKIFTTSLFALVLSAPFALADGCNSHSKEASMSCEVGQAWNAEAQQCVDTSA